MLKLHLILVAWKDRLQQKFTPLLSQIVVSLLRICVDLVCVTRHRYSPDSPAEKAWVCLPCHFVTESSLAELVSVDIFLSLQLKFAVLFLKLFISRQKRKTIQTVFHSLHFLLHLSGVFITIQRIKEDANRFMKSAVNWLLALPFNYICQAAKQNLVMIYFHIFTWNL